MWMPKDKTSLSRKDFIDFKNQSRPTASLLIQNNNKDAGTFDVIIKDVYSPKGVRTVQVPTWSDRMAKTIFAGMKRLVKQTETTRYRSKRAITRTLLVSTMFTSITFKMMDLGLVLVPQQQT